MSRRVVVVTTSYPRWEGDLAGSFVAASVRALGRAGAEVTVVAPDSPDAAPAPGVRRCRYHVLRRRQRLAYGPGIPEQIDGGSSAALQAPALAAALLAGAARAARGADRVVGHWLLPGALAGSLAARAAGVPHVAILHSAGVSLAERLPGGPLLAQGVALSSRRVVCTSEALRSRFLDLVGPLVRARMEGRVSVQPMGVDLAALGPEVPRGEARRRLGVAGRFVVGFLGRVVPVKGLRHLVEAAAGVQRITLAVAGDGPELPAAVALAAELGVDLRASGALAAGERRGFLAACDAFALPSVVLPDGRSEGTPVALLEALAVGLPVVASSVGGVPEVVQDGRSGFVVPPGDAVRLGRRLEALRAQPALRQRISVAARATGERYLWTAVGPRLSELILGA